MNTYDFLERLCVLLRAEIRAAGADAGLQPIHVQTLRYLVSCNRYSDSPLALAEFLGQTKGTVSQTVKVLEAKGLIRKTADAVDRRMVHLGLTDRGMELVRDSKADQRLAEAMAQLPTGVRDDLNDGLERLLRSLQQVNRCKSFAPCRTCRFNQPQPDGFRCGLTGEALSDHDVQLICREHAYPDEERR